MHVFDPRNLADIYELLIRLCEVGELVSPRGKPNRELRPVVIRTTEHVELAGAGVNYKFADAEAMAYLAGWDDLGWLERFNPRMAQFSDDGQTLHGAYGKRLEPQLRHAVSLLAQDKESRQVAMSIHEPRDLWTKSKDLPCNTQVLLKIRATGLHLTVIVRSQDVIWGLPYDHHCWWVVCRQLAMILGVEAGSVTHFIDSLHLYTPDAKFYDDGRVEKAKKASARPVGHHWPLVAGSIGQMKEQLKTVREEVEQPGVHPERLTPSVKRLIERFK